MDVNSEKQNQPNSGKAKLCGKLFLSTLLLSAFTFGGGYVIISLMQKKFVDELHWLKEEEMLNLTAIAQSSPGAVAVNAAMLLGFRVAGVAGAAVSLLGTVLPPLVIISVISVFYTAFRDNRVVAAVLRGMQAGVAAVIADVVITLGKNVLKSRDAVSVLIMLCAFLATYVFGLNIVYIILAAGAVGGIAATVRGRRKAKKSLPGEDAT